MKALNQIATLGLPVLGLSVLSLVSATAAQAETISQSQSVAAQTIWTDAPSGSQATPVFTASFDAFDPALGTLTAINIAGIWDLSGTIDVPGPDPTGGSINATGFYTVDGTDTSITYTAGGGGGGPMGSYPVTLMGGDAGGPLTDITDPSAFAAFQGTGSVDVSWEPTFTFSAPGATASLALTSGSIDVTYTYTPIPEPATASLALLAGVPMLLRRRRIG